MSLALVALLLARQSECANPEPAGLLQQVALYGGVFGLRADDLEQEVGAEFRFRKFWWELEPIVGIEHVSPTSTYLYAGLRREFELGEKWFAAPSMAAGLWEGGSADLGGPLEFRSALEVGYRISPRVRLSLTASHISNGSIYEVNTGSESVLLGISFDL
ncbi:MAG: acyloxyacyl hydrolase [Planctomycetes bacterium]|nr:acyloxyacyl hydrolase [Planctomycetota bacterium]